MAPQQTSEPADRRATLLYDRDCAFCRWSMRQVFAWDGSRRLRPLALQEPEAERLLGDLDEAERMASWHLIGPDGARTSAGRAVAPLLRVLRGGSRLADLAERFPRALDAAYAFVAGHRSTLSGAVKAVGADRPFVTPPGEPR